MRNILGYGRGLKIRRRAVPNAFNADALTYFGLVEADGGSIAAARKTAINSWFVASAAYRSKIVRANFFCADGLAGLFVPIVRVGGNVKDTNNNFVGGDYVVASGLTGDGSTKYLDTGLSFGVANDLIGLHAYRIGPAGIPVTAARLLGAYAAGGTNRADLSIYNNPVFSGAIGGPATGATFDAFAPGSPSLLSGVRLAGNVINNFVNGASVNSTATTAFTGPTGSIYAFAMDSVGSGTTDFTTSTLGAYVLTDGLTLAEVATLYTDLRTLMQALGRVP